MVGVVVYLFIMLQSYSSDIGYIKTYQRELTKVRDFATKYQSLPLKGMGQPELTSLVSSFMNARSDVRGTAFVELTYRMPGDDSIQTTFSHIGRALTCDPDKTDFGRPIDCWAGVNKDLEHLAMIADTASRFAHTANFGLFMKSYLEGTAGWAVLAMMPLGFFVCIRYLIPELRRLLGWRQ